MNQKIFLVEDSATVRAVLTQKLQTSAVSAEVVGHAEGERGALDWLRQNPTSWTLAIVDLFLKDGTGLGVLAGLRDVRNQAQRVVVLTDYRTAEFRFRCARLGADAVFDKTDGVASLLDFCIGANARL